MSTPEPPVTSTPAAAPHPPVMTAAGLQELQAELETLRRRGRDELAQRLRDARGYGGDSNNDEYHAVREEQMVIEARIAFLEDTVRRARVAADNGAADGAAVIGSTVTIEDLASGHTSRYRLVGAHQQPEPGVISAASPMGRALMGASSGAVATVDLPNGRSRSVRLVAVENA